MNRFEWERAVKASDLPPTRKLVLAMLATHANKAGLAYPSQATLASECGLSERAVRGHLTAAREAGWLDRTRKGGRVSDERVVSSEYLLTIPNRNDDAGSESAPTGTSVPIGTRPNRQMSATQPADERDPTGTPVPPISTRTVNESLSLSEQPPVATRETHGSAVERGETKVQERLRSSVASIQQLQTAQKWGRRMAGVIYTKEDLEEHFNADNHLRNFPGVFKTALDNWQRERTRLDVQAGKQVVR